VAISLLLIETAIYMTWILFVCNEMHLSAQGIACCNMQQQAGSTSSSSSSRRDSGLISPAACSPGSTADIVAWSIL
jgi:hypothetical protein